MPNNGTDTEIIEGVVEQANERGVKVAGEWRNASKFHPVDLPERGARVRLELDGKGFMRSVQVLSAGSPTAPASAPSARNGEIRRMAAMKAAANLVGAFAQTHEEVRTEHVFPLADKILAWLEQDADAANA